MNIDVWRTLIHYTNHPGNVIINSIIKIFLKYPWYQLLIYLLITVQRHLSHLWLSITPIQENNYINLLNYWISKNIKWLSQVRCYWFIAQRYHRGQHVVVQYNKERRLYLLEYTPSGYVRPVLYYQALAHKYTMKRNVKKWRKLYLINSQWMQINSY